MALFKLVDGPRVSPKPGTPQAYLIRDNWDDWGKFRTQFALVVFDSDGKKYQPGTVKIGEVGLKPSSTVRPGARAPSLEQQFDELNERHFSLGQEETYYETLNQLPQDLRDRLLKGLRDCALDLELFERMEDEVVMHESLLRFVRAENVRTRLHRLAKGDAKLTRFWFEYVTPHIGRAPPIELTFKVEPNSNPPTNVHVLIGRNGVGKTRCMQGMACALLDPDGRTSHSVGRLQPLRNANNDPLGLIAEEWSFAGLIFVSFSAFDAFELPNQAPRNLRSTLVGLHKSSAAKGEQATKTPAELAEDFVESFANCRQGLRSERWRAAVNTLGTDPLFEDADLAGLLDPIENWKAEAGKRFVRLSSGHAVVLLTITHLVESVDERTLVLLDEPEGHLHPPLLSAFIRSLADLLVKRNGVAIVATHSPVVLQEVPSSCIWVLRRAGDVCTAGRPSLETFGENVGILTREVFGLEVTNAGFHQLLRDAVNEGTPSLEEIVSRFGGQMGAEARAIASALIADRDAGEG